MLPAIRFTTVFVWTNQHSVATIIWALWKNEEFFLCFVIFAILDRLPVHEAVLPADAASTSPDMPAEFRSKSISAMEWLGRYSMTDVMVLALMIFYINASGYTEATVLPGIYFFAASAIMTMLAYGWAELGHAPASAPQTRRRQPSGALGRTRPAGRTAAAPTRGMMRRRTRRVRSRHAYTTFSPSICRNIGSTLASTNPSSRACAASNRSNGSLWATSSRPARSACATVTASEESLALVSTSAMPAPSPLLHSTYPSGP